MGGKITPEAMSQALCDFLKEEVLADETSVDAETSLSDIGVDSYSLMEIILFVEREFGISLPMETLTPENTQSVKALTACIQGINS
jgi:acyl carrier protein